MKKLFLVSIMVLFCGEALADSDVYLCGDPPPVEDTSLKGELNGKAQFLSRFIGDAKLKGKIETTRTEVFSKYPQADKLVVDHYLLYQTCIILMKDTSLNTSQKLEELRKTRREFQTVTSTQKVSGTCRHKDFGIEKWANDEVIAQSSGWVKGGSNPTNWCNNLIAQIVQGRSIGSTHKATVVKTAEDAKWTWDRKRLYNYSCTIHMQWNPIYYERQDASRCGYI